MWRTKDKLFDLLKLMHAENAGRISTVAADLLPEAVRQAGVLLWQCLFREPLFVVISGNLKDCVFVSPDSLMNYRLLRSGDQVLLVDTGVFGLLAALANYFVQLVVELAQLSHFLHHALVHEKRRPNCLVVFVGQLFQRQLNDSLVLQSLIPQ